MGRNEVLIIVMALIIAVILYDGFRRVRMARSGSIKMKIKPSGPSVEAGLEDEEDFVSAELPGGGARLIQRDEDPVEGNDDVTAVPMLMESISPAVKPRREIKEDQQDLFDKPMVAGERITDIAEEQTAAQSGDTETGQVIILHVVSSAGEAFEGRKLLHQLLACGMRFGEMNIFHRFSSPSGQGELLFSMANAVEPGTFDIDKMEDSETKGVSFFLQLPGPENPMDALNVLIEVTAKLSRELNGEIRDENRSVLTKQSIEHMRNRVQEFERQQKILS